MPELRRYRVGVLVEVEVDRRDDADRAGIGRSSEEFVRGVLGTFAERVEWVSVEPATSRTSRAGEVPDA